MASRGGRIPESYEPGDLNYHYNREDREAMLSEETKKALTKSKMFTLNRRNLIILIDIGIILIFAMIFIPLIVGGKSSAEIDGFKSVLRAYEYDGSILASLRVETGTDNPKEAGLVAVEFNIEGESGKIESVDLLPSEAETPRILRGEFPANEDSGRRIEAVVEINGKKRKLSVPIKTE